MGEDLLESIEADKARVSHCRAVASALSAPSMGAVWIELDARRTRLIERLVDADDPEVRGAIKEIDALLGLPQAMTSEASEIQAALSELDAA